MTVNPVYDLLVEAMDCVDRLALAVPAWAGGYYLDGRYCYNVGNTLYCDGGSSGSSSHSNRQRMEDQAEREDIQRKARGKPTSAP